MMMLLVPGVLGTLGSISSASPSPEFQHFIDRNTALVEENRTLRDKLTKGICTPDGAQYAPPPSGESPHAQDDTNEPAPDTTPSPAPSKFSGCWGTRETLDYITNDADGKKRATVSSFFVCTEQTSGRGRYVLRGQDLRGQRWGCEAQTTIAEGPDQFTAHYTGGSCTDGQPLPAADVTCKPAEQGALNCSEVEYLPDGRTEEPDEQVHGLKLYRIEAIPQ